MKRKNNVLIDINNLPKGETPDEILEDMFVKSGCLTDDELKNYVLIRLLKSCLKSLEKIH
jgi:hypothetical protein